MVGCDYFKNLYNLQFKGTINDFRIVVIILKINITYNLKTIGHLSTIVVITLKIDITYNSTDIQLLSRPIVITLKINTTYKDRKEK